MATNPDNLLGTPAGYASPEQLRQAREYAQYLLGGGGQQEVRHWTQGLSNIVNALAGGHMAYKANLGQMQRSNAAADLITGGPEAPAPSSYVLPGEGKTAPSPTIPPRTRTSGESPVIGEDNPVRKAVLASIAGSEAPDYRTLYGGGKFDDLSRHPGKAIPITSGPYAGKTSSAAGLFQFLKPTWDAQAKKLGLTDFSEKSQNAAAWDLAATTYKNKTGGDLETDAANPANAGKIADALKAVWPSLPGGDQPNKATASFPSRLAEYTKTLSGQTPVKDLAGKTGEELETARVLAQAPGTQTAQLQGGSANPGPQMRPDQTTAAPRQFDPQAEINRIASGMIRLGIPPQEAMTAAVQSVEGRARMLPKVTLNALGQQIVEQPGLPPRVIGDTIPGHQGEITPFPDAPGVSVRRWVKNGRVHTEYLLPDGRTSTPTSGPVPAGPAATAPQSPAPAPTAPAPAPTAPAPPRAAVPAAPQGTPASVEPAAPEGTPKLIPAAAPEVTPAQGTPAVPAQVPEPPKVYPARTGRKAWEKFLNEAKTQPTTPPFERPGLPMTANDAINFKANKELATERQKNFDKKEIEDSAKYYESAREASKLSNNLTPQLKVAEKIINDPKTELGAFAKPLNELYKIGLKIQEKANIDLGLDPTKPARQEQLGKILAGMTLESLRAFLPAGSGQIRVSEINLVQQALGGAELTRAGNRAVIDMVTRINDRTKDFYDMAIEWKKHHPILDARFDELVKRYDQENPLFTPEEIEHYQDIFTKGDQTPPPGGATAPPAPGVPTKMTDDELRKKLGI